MTTDKSNQIEVKVTPWSSDNFFEIRELHLYEELGGYVASGELDFQITSLDDKESLEKLTEELTGEIKIKDLRKNGLEYKIPIFVTSRSWKIMSFKISFVCIKNSNFYTKTNIQTFDNISVALNSLYPGEKSIRVDPDTSISKLPLYQKRSTDYDFCLNLCQSYRKDTIFCFGWEGLMIKELCGESNSYKEKDVIGTENPSIVVTDLEMGSLYPTTFNYDKLLNAEPILPEVTTKFCSTTLGYTNYYIQRAGYENLTWNRYYNQKLMNGKLYSTQVIKGIYMPRYKIGDVITYVVLSDPGPKTPYIGYLCYSNEFFYSILGAEHKDEGFKVSWKSKLVGLSKGTWAKDINEEEK